MKNFLKKYKVSILLVVLLFVGFAIRIFFVEKVVVGDLLVYTEWGESLMKNGPKDFYFRQGWLLSHPVYPPLSQLIFGAAYWLFDHKYFLAELHNLVKFPPAVFIVYFYKYGHILLLKLLSIISDLALSVIIYKLILKLSRNKKKAVFGLMFFLFNPITVFISGAWGQTDSVVALLGILSFLFLYRGNAFLSMLLLFLSLYFKPSWVIFGPFYLFLLLKKSRHTSVFFLVPLQHYCFWLQPPCRLAREMCFCMHGDFLRKDIRSR